jgi:hypothetical protein
VAAAIASVADLASRIDSPEFGPIRQLYDIHHAACSRLSMNSAGWAIASHAMGLPREAVEQQAIFIVRDRLTGHEAIINPVRARRKVAQDAAAPPRSSAGPAAAHCRWCQEWSVRQPELWADEWPHVLSADGRIGTRPNWARQSTVNGLTFGDERMHTLDALAESEFVGLFETAERYLTAARLVRPSVHFALLFLNGGPKSASSVEHAHVQIVAREERHFAYPEWVAARCPIDYWQRLFAAHKLAGLTVTEGECAGWVSLAPVKERDFTALSPNVTDGATFMYRIWRDLAREGTRNFSLAAILSPEYVTGQNGPDRFAGWPKLVWRFVDRGDPDISHGDIGTMELFGSAVIGNDPFAVAGLLRR